MSSDISEDPTCEVVAGDDQIGDVYELGTPIEDVAEVEQLDWSSLTVAALKAELAERGLQTTGRKAELVARLEAIGAGVELIATETNSEVNNSGIKTENEADTSNDNHEEQDEEDDEIPEGDEFVEWNEDGDHEVIVDEAKGIDETSDSFKLVEVVDELKQEPDEHKDVDELEVKTSGDKDDLNVEEGDVKQVDGELSVDVHREKDLFYLTWQSKKITVPFKGEITRDIQALSKMQTVIIYPIVLSDLYCEDLKKYAELATTVDVQLEETLPGSPPKGYLKLKFHSYAEALQAIEALKTFKEGVTVKNFSKEDNESHIMNRLRKEGCERKGPIIFRLVYVGNLSPDATEATLREHFPEALQVIIPHNEETMERLGYAYLEFADEKSAYDMSQKYKDAEINGEKLYVIQAISEKKEKYGLLRDSLRLYWSEQIHRLRRILDKPYSRPQWEISDMQQKIGILKRRIEKDDRRREVLRLPCPNYTEEKKDSGKSTTKTSDDKEKKSPSKKDPRSESREKRSTHRDERNKSRRSPRRSPLQQRRDYRPMRGQASNFQPRRDEVADKLVNQLQGLVSALTHKLPTVEPPRPLLDDIQFGPLASLLDQQRRLGAGSFASNNFRGSSYSNDQGSSRYSSNKRYGDDDYGGDRKRRLGDYDNSSAGSSRYASGNINISGRTGQAFNDNRYGGGSRRDNQGGVGGRQFPGRSKWP